MNKSIFSVFIFFIVTQSLLAQNDIPIGTWRTHFSFNKVNTAVQAGDLIYAGGDNGIFVYDKSDNSITKISKEEGLLGGAVNAMAYSTSASKLLIGYESGNLDIIEGNTIENIDLTSGSQVLGSKTINHITIESNIAFISTDFGVIKFDLNQNLAVETYRELGLTPAGDLSSLKVHMGLIHNDSLFIASEQGVLAANVIENINLLDRNNWKQFETIDGITDDPINIIAINNNQIYAGRNQEGIYVYQKNGEWVFQSDLLVDVDFLSANNSLIVADSTVHQLDDQFISSEIELDGSIIFDAFTAQDDVLWAASLNSGLVTNRSGGVESIKPSGPSSNLVFRVNYINNKVYALSGGFTGGVNPLGREQGFYTFESNQWTSFNNLAADDISTAEEFNNNIYVGSIGDGLLEISE